MRLVQLYNIVTESAKYACAVLTVNVPVRIMACTVIGAKKIMSVHAVLSDQSTFRGI